MGVYFQIDGFHRPRDLSQAVEILSRFGGKARIIAGGTDILPRRPGVKKNDSIRHLVDISNLDLNYLRKESDYFHIGAGTDLNKMGTFLLFSSNPYRALAEAVDSHSTTTIKNRATVGGNLCNASPCADLALPLLVLDAILVATGPNGTREIPIESFFEGINMSALGQAEVLLEIRIPISSEKAGTAFVKLRRQQTAIDMAVVNTATFLLCNQGRCEAARIALGAVGPIPFRAKKAESVLAGAELDGDVIQKAAAAAAEEARPIDDVRATAVYRKKMVAVLVRRALEESMRRCGQ